MFVSLLLRRTVSQFRHSLYLLYVFYVVCRGDPQYTHIAGLTHNSNLCTILQYIHAGKYGVSKLANREPPEESVNPFLQRYFEPIGLPENHEKVTKAMKFEIW